MPPFRVALAALVLSLAACTPWSEVPAQPTPGAVADPVAEMKLLLNCQRWPPAFIEVTPDYLKQTYSSVGSPTLSTHIIVFSRVSAIRIVTKDGRYLVRIFESDSKWPTEYRPSGNDLSTCKRFVSAFYALSHRPAPAATVQ